MLASISPIKKLMSLYQQTSFSTYKNLPDGRSSSLEHPNGKHLTPPEQWEIVLSWQLLV
jgi:hypothetical protein